MAKKKKGLAEKRSPSKSPSLFGSDMQSFFDDFSRGMGAWPLRHALDWEPLRRLEKAAGVMTPELDATETASEIRITAELPGIAEADVNVDLSGDRLTIRGEKREVREEDEKDFHVSERRYGSFSRTLRVPDSVDPEKVTAAMKDGVLTVVIPKTASAKATPRKIAVNKG